MNDGLLEVVVCPVTRSRLRRDGEFLVSERGGLRYPIKEGLPILLPDAAVLPPPYETVAEVRAAVALGKL